MVGGRARGDVLGIVLGAGRAGPTHERRAGRSAAARSAGLPQGARERLADRLRRRRAHPPRRSRRGAPGLPGPDRLRHPLERAGCRAVRRGRHVPADRGAQRRAAHVRRVRASTRRHLAVERAHGRVGLRLAAARRRPCRCGRSSPRGEGGVVALHIEGIDPEATGTITRDLQPGGRDRADRRSRRNDTSIDLPQYRVGSNTSSPITVTPYSRFDLPPGLGGSPSGAAATVWGNGIGAPTAPSLVAELGIRRRRHVDGDRPRLGGLGRRRVRTAVRDRPRGPAVHADGRRRAPHRSPGCADGDEYSFTLCVESWFDDDVFGAATTTQSRARPAGGQGPAGVHLRGGCRTERRRADGRTGSCAPSRRRPSASPTATASSSPGCRARSSGATRRSRCGTCTRSGGRRPRGRPSLPAPAARRTRCRRAGACRSASAGRTSSRSATRRTAAAAITFGNSGLRYYDSAGAILPHTVDTWTVPVGAVRVEGVSVAVDWSAQGWGLSPANTTFSASCDPNPPTP